MKGGCKSCWLLSSLWTYPVCGYTRRVMLWPRRMSRRRMGRMQGIVWQLDVRHVIRSRGGHGGRDKGCAGVRRVERVRNWGRACRLDAVLNGGEHCICPIWGARLTWLWLGDIGMTEGRTAGEFPRGVPKSGRGGMKGVAGSESMMDESWSFFPRVQLLSHTDWRPRKRAEMSARTKRKQLGQGRCLVFCADVIGSCCSLRDER